MANILILSLNFPPDGVSTAHLMGDLAEDLIANDHRVTVLTTEPHSNLDEVARASQPIQHLFGRLVGRSRYKGATVYHTFILKKTPSRAKRVLAWAVFHVISSITGFVLRIRADVILTLSPPLTMGVGAWFLGLRYKAPFVYSVQELYPDVAIEMGLIRNKALIRTSLAIEQFVYRKARHITAITPGIRRAILDKGVPPSKVVHIPNWVDIDEFRPSPKSNQFSHAHSIEEVFVVSYAGNIGLAQSFDELIDAARLLESVEDIRFLLVGGGVEKGRIDALVEGLTNVLVLPHQPYKLMPEIYAGSDLSYVPLPIGLGSAAMPSKVYKIMSSGRAVLAHASEDSDLALLVRTAECGFVVEPGSSRALADVILVAYSDRQRTKAMGEGGRRYVEEKTSRQVVMDQYLRLIASVTS